MNSGPTYIVQTSGFAVDPDEDERTSYRVYGRAFARWLAGRLREIGRPVEDVLPKPFGWCVLVKSEPFPLWIACANRDGGTAAWSARVIAEPSLLQATFERAAVAQAVEKLSDMLAELLPGAPGVTSCERE
jgi:hypothetical protein